MAVLKEGSRPPWVGLAAALWLQIAAGNAYNFPLYSSSLKSVLGFNQMHITFLGVANDIGENLGIVPGVVCNKFSPWVLLLIGSIASFVGYGVLWLAITQTVHNLPFWVLWIALCIATNSNAWFGTAVLVTNMRNFPLSRGTVAGILKAYVGLSAAVYTEIFSMILNASASNLLLSLSLCLPILALATMYFVRPCTPVSGETSSDHSHFLFTQASAFALSLFLLITTILYDSLSLGRTFCYAFIAVMILFLLSPLAIPIKMTFLPSGKRIPAEQTEALIVPEPEGESDLDILIAEGEGAIRKKRRPRRGDDFGFWEGLVKADFWLLWLVYCLGVGSGVTVLNNLAQIGAAVGVDDTTILLSIFSFSNFLGRLGFGALSEHFVRTRTIPRTVWMTCSQILMIVIFLLYAWGITSIIYVATALLGVCFGTQFSIMIPTVSELFGLKHFGLFFNFIGLGNPIGALFFSAFLASSVYDAEAARQHTSTCMGHACFRLTFLILAGASAVGALLSVILTVRIKPVYQMLYAGGSFRQNTNTG